MIYDITSYIKAGIQTFMTYLRLLWKFNPSPHSQRFFHANIFQVRAIAIILLSLNLKEGRKLHKTTQYSTVQYSTVQFSLLLHVFGVWCGGEICTRCATPRPTIECESSIIPFHPPPPLHHTPYHARPPLPILASTPLP